MKNKIFGKVLLFGTIFLFVWAGVASALNENLITNYKPSTFGNWLYVGGGEGNYTKIQDAIDDAVDGDTVFVFDDSSPYQENIRINKQIFVIGENKDTTVISGVTGQEHAVRISYKNAEISGFTIIGAAEGQDGVCVFPLTDTANISNNIIKDSAYGILLQTTSTRTTISNNIISNNDFHGILLQQSDRNNIIGNTITGNGDFGIVLELVSKQNWIVNNTIEDNFAGIQITGGSQNNIIDNEILNNDMEGILIEGILSTSNVITGNKISGNRAAIKISSSGKNTITDNNIIDNKMFGISLSLSNENIIEKNNFIGNNIHAFFVASFGNNWDSNYWDNWVGVLFELPIFKKLPKIIRGIALRNFDSNPQEEPYDI